MDNSAASTKPKKHRQKFISPNEVEILSTSMAASWLKDVCAPLMHALSGTVSQDGKKSENGPADNGNTRSVTNPVPKSPVTGTARTHGTGSVPLSPKGRKTSVVREPDLLGPSLHAPVELPSEPKVVALAADVSVASSQSYDDSLLLPPLIIDDRSESPILLDQDTSVEVWVPPVADLGRVLPALPNEIQRLVSISPDGTKNDAAADKTVTEQQDRLPAQEGLSKRKQPVPLAVAPVERAVAVEEGEITSNAVRNSPKQAPVASVSGILRRGASKRGSSGSGSDVEVPPVKKSRLGVRFEVEPSEKDHEMETSTAVTGSRSGSASSKSTDDATKKVAERDAEKQDSLRRTEAPKLLSETPEVKVAPAPAVTERPSPVVNVARLPPRVTPAPSKSGMCPPGDKLSQVLEKVKTNNMDARLLAHQKHAIKKRASTSYGSRNLLPRPAFAEHDHKLPGENTRRVANVPKFPKEQEFPPSRQVLPPAAREPEIHPPPRQVLPPAPRAPKLASPAVPVEDIPMPASPRPSPKKLTPKKDAVPKHVHPVPRGGRSPLQNTVSTPVDNSRPISNSSGTPPPSTSGNVAKLPAAKFPGFRAPPKSFLTDFLKDSAAALPLVVDMPPKIRPLPSVVQVAQVDSSQSPSQLPTSPAGFIDLLGFPGVPQSPSRSSDESCREPRLGPAGQSAPWGEAAASWGTQAADPRAHRRALLSQRPETNVPVYAGQPNATPSATASGPPSALPQRKISINLPNVLVRNHVPPNLPNIPPNGSPRSYPGMPSPVTSYPGMPSPVTSRPDKVVAAGYSKCETSIQNRLYDYVLRQKVQLDLKLIKTQWRLSDKIDTAQAPQLPLMHTPEIYSESVMKCIRSELLREVKNALELRAETPSTTALKAVYVDRHSGDSRSPGVARLTTVFVKGPADDLKAFSQHDLLIYKGIFDIPGTASQKICFAVVEKNSAAEDQREVVLFLDPAIGAPTTSPELQNIWLLKVCNLDVAYRHTRSLIKFEECVLRSAFSGLLRLNFSILPPEPVLQRAVGALAPKLNPHQRFAVCAIVRAVCQTGKETEKMCVLQGAPGTGKYLVAVHAMKHILAETTGKILIVLPTEDMAVEAVKRIYKFWHERTALEPSSVSERPLNLVYFDLILKDKRLDSALEELRRYALSSILRPVESDCLDNIDAVKKRLRDEKDAVQKSLIRESLNSYNQTLENLRSEPVKPMSKAEADERRRKIKHKLAQTDIIVASVAQVTHGESNWCLQDFEYSCLFVLDAGRLPEVELLLPIAFLLDPPTRHSPNPRNGYRKVVVMGCAYDVPVSPEDGSEVQRGPLARSFLERMWTSHKGAANPLAEDPSSNMMLSLMMQYQMDKEIAKFPSSHFYANGLVDVPFRSDWKLAPYLVFDLNYCECPEPNAMIEMTKELLKSHSDKSSYTLLTRTRSSWKSLDELIKKEPALSSVTVSRAIDYQGKQSDIVLFTAAGSNCNDKYEEFERRKLFAAITIARRTLLILMKLPSVKESKTYQALINDARERRLFIPMPPKSTIQELTRYVVKTSGRYLYPQNAD